MLIAYIPEISFSNAVHELPQISKTVISEGIQTAFWRYFMGKMALGEGVLQASSIPCSFHIQTDPFQVLYMSMVVNLNRQ
jgi:hypothetical protein